MDMNHRVPQICFPCFRYQFAIVNLGLCSGSYRATVLFALRVTDLCDRKNEAIPFVNILQIKSSF